MSLLRYHIKEFSMRNKVKAKVLHYVHIGKEIDYKRVVLDFEEYMNDILVMDELKGMDVNDALKIIKEVWEEIKSEI